MADTFSFEHYLSLAPGMKDDWRQEFSVELSARLADGVKRGLGVEEAIDDVVSWIRGLGYPIYSISWNEERQRWGPSYVTESALDFEFFLDVEGVEVEEAVGRGGCPD